jgi:glycosyltransferase involved in cell wall biosynthesis
MTARPRAVFVGVTYAGWATRQQNLERHVVEDGRLDASFHRVSGWRDGGLVERLPLPRSVRGRVRATLEASALAAIPRPDVVWTSGRELLLPYLPAFVGPVNRPLVVELDWTVSQQEEMAPWYFGRPPRTGLRLDLLLARQKAVFSRVTLFTPMSHWAADGLRAAGVPDDRIRVLNPGLDLDQWSFTPRNRAEEGPLRLLFVGGDLVRKGGDLVVDAIAGPFAGRVVADIVTRDAVAPTPGVTVHRCEPNDPELLELYANADLFVMPTRADCYGHAVVEALASGLPAIVGDVGGVRDIVDDGSTGWCIRPDRPGFFAALAEAEAARSRLPEMGREARRTAERRFDGQRNDRLLVDVMLELAERSDRAPSVASVSGSAP